MVPQMTNTNLERQDSPLFASKFHFTQTNSQPLDPYQRWSSRASPKHAEGFQSPTAMTGDDVLVGGPGSDIIYGGPGDDTFVANSFSTRHATVADWAVGFDIIDLHELLAARHLDASSVYFDT